MCSAVRSLIVTRVIYLFISLSGFKTPLSSAIARVPFLVKGNCKRNEMLKFRLRLLYGKMHDSHYIA